MTYETRAEMSLSDVWAPAMLSLAFAADYVGVTVDHVAGWPTGVGLALVTVVTAACCMRVRLPIAVGVAVLGWAFLTGFVVNHDGQLHVTGTGDLWRLLVLLGTAALVSRATTPPPPAAIMHVPSRRNVHDRCEGLGVAASGACSRTGR